jgi:hypothetical protein
MATTATCNITASIVEEQMNTCGACGYSDELNVNGHFFRGVLIAIPAGLLLWAGLLRVAGEVLHRL